MQPFIPYEAYTSGTLAMLFINLTKAQDGFFGEKELDPGIGPLQLDVVLNKAPTSDASLIVTRLFNDTVLVGNGRVQRSW